MSDYKAMYFTLFNAVTDALELLKKGQQEGEKLYIENDDEELEKVDPASSD